MKGCHGTLEPINEFVNFCKEKIKELSNSSVSLNMYLRVPSK